MQYGKKIRRGDTLEKKKGTYKRYAGRITAEVTNGMVLSAIIDGLVESGIEIVSHPILDDEERFLGETMDLYEVV